MTHFVLGLPVKEASGKVDTGAAGTMYKSAMLLNPATEEVAVSGNAAASAQNGFRYDSGDKLVVEDLLGGAMGAGATWLGGKPFRAATGALIVDSSLAVAYWHSGLPFCSNGAVATA